MTYIASISGGQDSTAMTLRLLELGEKVDYILFTDTGYELPEMYEYIKKCDEFFKKKFNIGITTIPPTTTIEEWAFTPYIEGENKGKLRGLPVAMGMSYCTRELKIYQTQRFIKSLKIELKNATCYIGYVARETKRKCGNNGYKCLYPLKEWGWNEPQVQQYLKEKSIYNKLYDDFSRTGCFCCPKQRIDSWKVIYNKYPKQWDWCKEMEEKAKKAGCVIQTWRGDGIPLHVREKQFEKEKRIQTFSFDWNEQDVSCFCK